MNYRIAEGLDQIRLEDAARLLKTTYWASSRPIETIERSMKHSDCFGVYIEGEDRLVGFARVISDYATTYYLCDVVIDEAYRHQGLGRALLSHIVSYPAYSGLRGLLLTQDAHKFYEPFGFETINNRAMMKSPKR